MASRPHWPAVRQGVGTAGRQWQRCDPEALPSHGPGAGGYGCLKMVKSASSTCPATVVKKNAFNKHSEALPSQSPWCMWVQLPPMDGLLWVTGTAASYRVGLFLVIMGCYGLSWVWVVTQQHCPRVALVQVGAAALHKKSVPINHQPPPARILNLE